MEGRKKGEKRIKIENKLRKGMNESKRCLMKKRNKVTEKRGKKKRVRKRKKDIYR